MYVMVHFICIKNSNCKERDAINTKLIFAHSGIQSGNFRLRRTRATNCARRFDIQKRLRFNRVIPVLFTRTTLQTYEKYLVLIFSDITIVRIVLKFDKYRSLLTVKF